MPSHVHDDPYAGEAQWVLAIAREQLPPETDITDWYLNMEIPALDGLTPAQLLQRGEATALVRYLLGHKASTPDRP